MSKKKTKKATADKPAKQKRKDGKKIRTWKPSGDAMNAFIEAKAEVEAEVAKAQSIAQSKTRQAIMDLKEAADVPEGVAVAFDGSRFVEDPNASE